MYFLRGYRGLYNGVINGDIWFRVEGFSPKLGDFSGAVSVIISKDYPV